ncbi:MAG: hypothetical protein JST13_11345, partial [Bacteroidetes bacterium]|nr:hypothetical protein [Bacteroidota bacterium]
ASYNNAAVGVYGEQRFLLKETSFYSFAFALPTSSGSFGAVANYFGYSDYNESQIGIAYGKSLGKVIAIGAQFNYYHVQMAGYGNMGAINFEIAAMFHPAEKTHLGLHAYNPLGGKLGKNSEEKLASLYNIGMGYEASKQVFVSAEIVKEENKPVNVNAAMQYIFAEQFFARAGIQTLTSSPYAGIGLLWEHFRIDIAVGYHPQLGLTPGLLLQYAFEENK